MTCTVRGLLAAMVVGHPEPEVGPSGTSLVIHGARAAVDGIAYQVRDVIDVLAEAQRTSLDAIRALTTGVDRFDPVGDSAARDAGYRGWQGAVQRAAGALESGTSA